MDVAAVGAYQILGQTLDDAAGEAFDKTAKILNLGFPGGRAIADAARDGRPGRFTFTRPMLKKTGLDFSFSGLKTQARATAARHNLDRQTVADIARAFEDAVVDTLAVKCARALRQTKRKQLILSGGVGANAKLRERLRQTANEFGARVFYPRPELCTDNGAMIAYAGYVRLTDANLIKRADAVAHDNAVRGDAVNYSFDVRPRWPIEEI